MAEKTSKRSTFREYLEALLIAGIFLGFSNTFVVKTFYIPSGSMEDTLLVGDHLFVNRMIYGAAPTAFERAVMPVRDVERGDVVIFRSVERPRVDMVKRCVGLPGDTVQIVDKKLFLNGRRVEDDAYAVHKDRRVLPAGVSQRDHFGPYTVPEERYFCMGDNRDFSHDSRFWAGVPRSFVKGRASVIYWSYGGETSDGVWRGTGEKLKQIVGTVAGFFTKTRWGRTLMLVR
ncbi:MAG: signal peptidase I [Thermoanaerobaculia bacterium]|nr:signal peptidase I [Thermoanaerobaculia bacterium]